MNGSYTLISVVAFCISLFLYIHIKHHRKRSNELDVYYIDYPSKEKLDEVCEMRQPVVFTAGRIYSRETSRCYQNTL